MLIWWVEETESCHIFFNLHIRFFPDIFFPSLLFFNLYFFFILPLEANKIFKRQVLRTLIKKVIPRRKHAEPQLGLGPNAARNSDQGLENRRFNISAQKSMIILERMW